MAQGSDVASTITRLILEGKTNKYCSLNLILTEKQYLLRVRIGSDIATETGSVNSYRHVSRIYDCGWGWREEPKTDEDGAEDEDEEEDEVEENKSKAEGDGEQERENG
ncbi:Protein of unknown function [Pyronema omphalodes CBS 100304]|uniref:Uncharacterized protein n=1 Tax=Pyronema omphalodes (strain CBS 100304) TaxID=1076935 RepID=U4LPU3_PYROM|nr:Protein of unknown function [Pyronema omphalodes CBS 100304]